MIYAEKKSGRWAFLIVWVDRPSVWCYTLHDAERMYALTCAN